MPYLVDGNNVMAQVVGWHRNPGAARKRLIHHLARFVATHRAKVKVVFDGAPDAEFPEGRKFKSVHILYARAGSDADERIKELIASSSHKRDTIMVSSDKALVSFANRQGLKVLSSGKFRLMLEECATEDAEGFSADDKTDVTEWLEFFEKGKD